LLKKKKLINTTKLMNFFYLCTQSVGTVSMGKGRLSAWLSMPRRQTLTCALLSLCIIASAKTNANDSIQEKTFRPTHLIAPAVLIAIGSVGVSNGWFCSVKNDVRDGLQELRGDCRFKADDYLQYVPVVANLGLGFVGAKAKHSFKERVAVTATAYAAMGAMVNIVKYTVREKRPGSETRNSFPSGHTATAFMGAELVRGEYGNWYGLGAYTLATGVAFLRLYNDRHWLNDVLAGAGTGILAARIGFWLLPLERKLFRWDKAPAAVSLIPTYSPDTHTAGIALAATF
jgi:membrane-associated phospholipid phosphatase